MLTENINNKSDTFKSNPQLDTIINELRNFLLPLQPDIKNNYSDTFWPVTMIVGVPRSGTTLLLQLLSSTGAFCYPSNLINRFAYLPYIGSLVQRILFDPKCDYQDEFKDIKSEVNYQSNLGVSRGALATSEFQHFFREFLPKQEDGYIRKQKLKDVDVQGISSGLASIEHVFKKPLVCKGILLQNNLEYFSKVLPKTIIISIERTPIYNMQSLYLARKKYTGSTNVWWSLRPKEYAKLKDREVFDQIAGQVYFLRKAIDLGLKTLPIERKSFFSYEDICNNPIMVYETIKNKYSSLGYKLDWPQIKLPKFHANNHLLLSKEEIRRFKCAYENFDSADSNDH